MSYPYNHWVKPCSKRLHPPDIARKSCRSPAWPMAEARTGHVTFRASAIYEELEWHNIMRISLGYHGWIWKDLGLWGLWLSSMDCSFRFISQKGSCTMVCTISREASADMDLQPAYCKLERINSEWSHGWFLNLWAARRRRKSGVQVMSISYQAKFLLSAMCILVCIQ